MAALVLDALSAQAVGIYPSHTTGYDISTPQCNTPSNSLPTGAFGIVGVNAGRPFSFSSCLATEFNHASATPSASLYINTAYSGAYKRSITPFCNNNVPMSIPRTYRQAWSIGCSEADTSLTYATQHGAGTGVAMWWLDVEVGNSWSSSNLALNQFAIQGASDRFTQAKFPAGVYSTQSSWQTITGGGYTPPNSSADWVAGQGGSCPGTSFDARPVWLSQYVNGFDFDNAC